MKYKTKYALIIAAMIAGFTTTAFADDDQATQDQNTVVGACMIQKFKENKPPISQAVIEKCADSSSDDAAKCLGLKDDNYLSMVKFCIAQLNNAKCVAGKMKVSLIQYADCAYEQDPVACYKSLGYSAAEVKKLSLDCKSEEKI